VTGVRRHGAHRLVPLAIDSALLVGLLFGVLNASHPSPLIEPIVRSATSNLSESLPAAELTVSPATFWMRAGENLSLEALWSSGTPRCTVAPLSYRWSVSEGTATGFLNATSGSATTFFADSFDSGTVSVMVRAVAAVDCGPNATAVNRLAAAEITVVTPLSLRGVVVGPNPLLPGSLANLRGEISGGAPPYVVNVVWGDGTRTVVNLSAPGTFSANHSFPAGDFVPYVVAGDSEGDLANRSVPEALSVGSGFVVAVNSASYTSEVGLATEFFGVTENAPPGSVILLDCTNATVGPIVPPASGSNTTSFFCTFDEPGTSEVFFGVYPPTPGGVSASAVLYETVVAPPKLAVTPLEAEGEVGGSAYVEATLTGGVMPAVLAWNLTGNRSSGIVVVDSDGGGVLSLSLVAAGEYSLGLEATDALGLVGTNSSFFVQVNPSIAAQASAASTFQPHGVLAQVIGAVLAGCPPFSWWVVPQFVSLNGSADNGSLVTVGDFSWSATYAREGSLSVDLGVTDTCGAVWQTALLLPLVPLLEADVTVVPVPAPPNSTLAVNASIEGGWPPFLLGVNASDGESWNRTIPSDGAFRCALPARANGALALSVSVSDSLGAEVDFRLTVVLPSNGPRSLTPAPSGTTGPATGSGTPSSLDVLGLLASLAVPVGIGTYITVLWRRHSRKNKPRVPGPDPVAVLKRILLPAEGAERFTVELLAEEQGIPLTEVRAAIDHLVAQGTIRSESGADGEEVLSWSESGGH